MYLSLLKCDDWLYTEAKAFFLKQWRSDLLYKQSNSLIGAYLITKHMYESWKDWFSFIDGIYHYQDWFFSTSHSQDFLLLAISNKKVAVDMEIIQQRDQSLLKSIQNFPSILKGWNDWKKSELKLSDREKFYIQRCAKECLVKFLNLNSEDMTEISVMSLSKNQNFIIDGRVFDLVISVQYLWKIYQIYASITDEKVISILW